MEHKHSTQAKESGHSRRRAPLSHPLHRPFRWWFGLLAHHPVELPLAATIILLLFGGTLMFFTERASPLTSVHSWWDAVWLCTTSVTENYGDVGPTTTLSRLVTIFVAFVGLVLLGSFTGAVTNYLTGAGREEQLGAMEDLKQRLQRIEELLQQGGKG